jgi:hypothetical protein
LALLSGWLLVATVLVLTANAREPAPETGTAWKRHTLDDSSRGADGVRLADVNGDGHPDIVTGWEQGGPIRVYLNPGPAKAKAKWPAVTVGKVGRPEDAVFADLDGDGAVDVVSCCEGSVRSVFVHWAPKERDQYLDPAAWNTEAVPALKGKQMWMFCLPMQVDHKHGIDLVVGAKGQGAQVGWLEAPGNPRDLAAWKWHPLYEAGWVMSLAAADVNGDGHFDVVASDWKGPGRGCLWLENPGPGDNQFRPWKCHRIGAGAARFLDLADLDGDGRIDVVAAQERELLFFRRKPGPTVESERHVIAFPPNAGNGKSVRVGDVNGDGKRDLVFSCVQAQGKSGVMWLSYRKAPTDPEWDAHEVSGIDGIKHDLVQLLDLDGDGDLDVLTCEETKNLGVFWYENPRK